MRGFSRNTAHEDRLHLIPLGNRWREFESQLLAYVAPAILSESAHRSISTKSHLFPNTSRAISLREDPDEGAEALRDPEVNLIEGAPLWNKVSTIARPIAR